MKPLLGAIYPYAFFLLYLIIPFDNYIRVLPNILLATLVVAFPFVVAKADFNKLKTPPVILFLGFFLFLIIDAIVFGRLESDFNIIKKVLIAVGLVLLYLPVIDVGKIKKAIIFSSIAAIIFSAINIVIDNNISGDLIFENYPRLIESLLIDRIYLGFLSVLSILISYQSLRPKYHPDNRYYLANIIVNILFLLLIVSKIAILILLLLLVLRQFYGQNKKIRLFVTLLVLVVVSIVFLVVKDDIKTNEFLTTRTQASDSYIKNTLTWDIRTVVWHCAIEVAMETGITFEGLGFTGTKDKLITCYSTVIEDPQKSDLFISERYNTHNQFIDFYLSSGFIALGLFLGLLISLFIRIRRNYFATALLLVFISYCCMENVFHRQLGAYYAGFVLIILLTDSWKIKTLRE
jgi:O-antigen ligase